MYFSTGQGHDGLHKAESITGMLFATDTLKTAIGRLQEIKLMKKTESHIPPSHVKPTGKSTKKPAGSKKAKQQQEDPEKSKNKETKPEQPAPQEPYE